MRVIALKAWSNGSFSMEEKQIADLPDALAEALIEGGIVAPTALPAITDADDGKVLTADSGEWVARTPASGGGVLVVNGTWNEAGTECTLDKTWQEIHDGGFGVVKMAGENDLSYSPIVRVYSGLSTYGVIVITDAETVTTLRFTASSASGYPTVSE